MTSIMGHSVDLPVADESVVYQSDRTIVRRVAVGGAAGTVILKEPLGADSEQRRRHETAILRRLAGVPGVPELVTAVAVPEVIVLEDLGGSPLRDLSPVAGPALVDLALRVATVVAAVHRRGVVHKDISPSNVVLTADGRASLIDFELATTFAEERPSFIHQSQIAGTLAYMAPEQTGRTGGSVDQRADLYSLGATLYELATGRPPFGEDDPLQLIHCHLAELPAAPAELNPDVPAPLSDIILRLLEKEPDRRYQSAEATLDSYAADVQAGLTFAARTGNEQVRAVSLLFWQLVRVLRDDSDDPTAAFDGPAYLATVEGHPITTVYHHINRALAAAMFGEQEALDRHSAAAMPMLHLIQASYARSRAYLLRALSLAAQVRGGRAEAAAELDACREWLARRAADNPATFGHQVRLIDAERAWAAGAPHEATVAYDIALCEVANRRRPWHHALIAERAATFHLASGSQHIGRHLLTEALRGYQAWGATAKVRQLEAEYPFLRGAADNAARRGGPAATTRVSVESIDLLAVLKASQALSSETNLDRLRERVGEVLRTLTGASIVRVLLRGGTGWYVSDDAGASIPVDEAGDRGLLPLTAFRYAERTRTPLLVEDATQDDRFARDPYVQALDRCSLLAVPILSQGDLRAMVLLENRLSRNAFTVDRLDAVLLIAGQLSVSMDNARLYASLERKVAGRTQELEVANRRLQQLSITDPLTGLANRRQLDDRLAAEWQRGPHTSGQIAVAMIDVDHFKLYNDHYGHPAGDACLRKVAAAAAAGVRGADLVARYGGEEFAIVLHCDDLEAARVAAERVRAAVEALEEPHERASTGWVTVSIGVACMVPGPDNSPEHLIEAADAQLYQAKRGGRNRVS